MRGRLLALVLVLAGTGGARVGAQEPPDSAGVPPADSTRQEPDSVAPPQPPRLIGPRFSVSVTVGSAGFGELQTQPILARRTDLSGAVLDSALVSRSLVADGALHAAASAALALTPAWVLRVGAGVTRGSLRREYGGAPDFLIQEVGPITIDLLDPLAGARTVDFSVLELESALHYRIPSRRRLQPYLELGAVMTRWAVDEPVPGAAGLDDGVTRFGAMGAVGGRLPLKEWLSLSLRISTRALGNPVPRSRGPLTVPGSTLDLSFQDEGASPFADGTRETLRVLRLEAGLSLDLGRAAEPPPDQSEPDVSTSPTGR